MADLISHVFVEYGSTKYLVSKMAFWVEIFFLACFYCMPVTWIDVNLLRWSVIDIKSGLILSMACRLYGTKPLPEPVLIYCQLNPQEQSSVDIPSK